MNTDDRISYTIFECKITQTKIICLDSFHFTHQYNARKKCPACHRTIYTNYNNEKTIVLSVGYVKKIINIIFEKSKLDIDLIDKSEWEFLTMFDLYSIYDIKQYYYNRVKVLLRKAHASCQ